MEIELSNWKCFSFVCCCCCCSAISIYCMFEIERGTNCAQMKFIQRIWRHLPEDNNNDNTYDIHEHKLWMLCSVYIWKKYCARKELQDPFGKLNSVLWPCHRAVKIVYFSYISYGFQTNAGHLCHWLWINGFVTCRIFCCVDFRLLLYVCCCRFQLRPSNTFVLPFFYVFFCLFVSISLSFGFLVLLKPFFSVSFVFFFHCCCRY